jgi:predicted hydrocarbon binding protein
MHEETFSLRYITWSNLEDSLIDHLTFYTSPGTAMRVIHDIGETCGRRSYRRIMERYQPLSKSALLETIREIKAEQRWGIIDFQGLDLENQQGMIIVKNSFEAKEREKTQPFCHFFRGYLSGFLSHVFDRAITVVEEACLAKGDQHCQFKVTPAS